MCSGYEPSSPPPSSVLSPLPSTATVGSSASHSGGDQSAPWWTALTGDPSSRPPPLRRRRTSESGTSQDSWDNVDELYQDIDDTDRKRKTPSASTQDTAPPDSLDLTGLDGEPAREWVQDLARRDREWRAKFSVSGELALEAATRNLERRITKVCAQTPRGLLGDADVIKSAYDLLHDLVVARRLLYKARVAASGVPLGEMSAEHQGCVRVDTTRVAGGQRKSWCARGWTTRRASRSSGRCGTPSSSPRPRPRSASRRCRPSCSTRSACP